MDEPGLFASLSSIATPTSVALGDQDPIQPLGHGAALGAAIPSTFLQGVPGVGQVVTSPGLLDKVADLIQL